jgi:hypothetical protein
VSKSAAPPIPRASEDSPFWEPIAFRYGDRVRIQLSPECRCYAIRTRPGAHFDGALGTVVGRFRRQTGFAAHEIEVLPDVPWVDECDEVESEDWCIFAASELELLDPGR